ncbi:MAG: Fe-S cluster assembly protein SufD [Pyrinomonadaceae bacterium]
MVTELAKTENGYQSAFRTMRDERPSARWVELVRESAMDRFQALGFPSVTEEEWRYTNLAQLVKSQFEPAVRESEAIDASAFSYPETIGAHIVLVDGFYREELSAAAGLADVVVIDLFQAIADGRYGKLVREYLARNAGYHDNGLAALNTAFLQSGVLILVPKNVKIDSPIQITCIANGRRAEAANFPRALVVMEQNSSATFVERYASVGQKQYFTNSVVEVVVKDGACLDHYRLQQESADAFHVGMTAVELGRTSSYTATSITLGARLSRHDIRVMMDHEGANCHVDGLYVVGSNQHADTHSVIDHKQPYCSSRQLYKGILDGNGRAVFNGKIFVRHGAVKTDAIQTNKNLLLSQSARVDTKPQLEIFADDVKCAHGAAVGQLDEDELFYLKTRGINPELARNLLTYGFAEEVIEKIAVESIKAELNEAVLHRLHAKLEG